MDGLGRGGASAIQLCTCFTSGLARKDWTWAMVGRVMAGRESP